MQEFEFLHFAESVRVDDEARRLAEKWMGPLTAAVQATDATPESTQSEARSGNGRASQQPNTRRRWKDLGAKQPATSRDFKVYGDPGRYFRK